MAANSYPTQGPQNLVKNADPQKVKAFMGGFSGDDDEEKQKKAKLEAMRQRLAKG